MVLLDILYLYFNLQFRNNVEAVVVFQLPVQSVSINTKVMSLNPVHGRVYSIQHYTIKVVSGFLQVLRFPLPIKLTSTI